MRPSKNIFSGPLSHCSHQPKTCFFRNGCCDTDATDRGGDPAEELDPRGHDQETHRGADPEHRVLLLELSPPDKVDDEQEEHEASGDREQARLGIDHGV